MDYRLKAIAAKITSSKGFIDVGTDHGYLPIYMLNNGYSGEIFASDINSGPLDSARSNFKAAGFTDKINVIQCNGLDDCPQDRIDTIIIAGMGGELITGILDRAEWCMSSEYNLILQPMTKPEILRYWLINNGFSITSDTIIKTDRYYQLITAKFTNDFTVKYSEAEYYCGAYSNGKHSEYYYEYIEYLFRRFDKICRQTESVNNYIIGKSLNHTILSQLQQMRSKYAYNK